MQKFAITSLAILTLTLSACGAKPVVNDDDKILKIQKYNAIMKVGKDLIDPVHGKETDFWYGALSGTPDTPANGVAYVHRFADGTAVFTANLNILQAPKGSSYVVMLKDDVTGKTIEGSELSSIIGDARHSARFETKEDVAQYLHVQVFKKTTFRSILVAEGTLKKPSTPTTSKEGN